MRQRRGIWATAAVCATLSGGCSKVIVATPGDGAPDVSTASAAQRDGRFDAAVIVVDERSGADALGRAWARYLIHDRKVPAARVRFVPARRAGARQVDRALARARRTIRTGGALWLITIGYGSTTADGTGVLRLGADDEGLAVDDVLAKLGWGPQSSSIWIADACARDSIADGRPGLRATTHGTTTQRVTRFSESTDGGGVEEEPEQAPPVSLTDGIATDSHALEHTAAAWSSATDLAVIAAGLGRRCSETDGSDYPWLAYAMLGALRGWADSNADGRVSTEEAVVYAARWQEAHDPDAIVGAAGTNLVLARIDAPEGDPLPTPKSVVAENAEARTDIASSLASPSPVTDAPALPPKGLPAVELGLDDRVHVPTGWFRMGCVTGDADCEPDEKPDRHLFLEQFTIERHEVTWGEYADCIDAGECTTIKLDTCYVWTPDHGFVRGAPFDRAMIGEDLPVVCASWAAANRYCEWTGQQLPTEAQWERAARGDTFTRYPWGDAVPTCDLARHDGCGDVTRSVHEASLGASPTGAQDMAGNVWEWVADWYDEDAYSGRRRRNPKGPAFGKVRVLRGGSFYDGAPSLRISYRYALSPQYGYSNVGFRCARQ